MNRSTVEAIATCSKSSASSACSAATLGLRLVSVWTSLWMVQRLPQNSSVYSFGRPGEKRFSMLPNLTTLS